MKKTNPKSIHEIRHEWNDVGLKRSKIINAGHDISFSYVTAPCIMRHIKEDRPSFVLDVGCGTGQLTYEIAKISSFCMGIDISESCIEAAKQAYSEANLKFKTIEAKKLSVDYKFDVCISNMVLMSDPEWILSIKNIYHLLAEGGYLYIMLAHPCLWPKYWGFENASWFHYDQETFIESCFSISLEKAIGTTTYIHRPLATYFQAILSSGFKVLSVEEPVPTKPIPTDYSYDYPRFLFIKCQKIVQ